jgi:hypothetical protein
MPNLLCLTAWAKPLILSFDKKEREMKGTKKGEQKKEIELINDKEKNIPKKRSNNKTSVSFFASALAQGIVPQVLNDELFKGLSMLGNSNFIEAIERKEARNRELKDYVERDTFDFAEVSGLKENLADNFYQNIVNEIEIIKAKPDWIEVPDTVAGEAVYLSSLSPVDFSGGTEIMAQEIINE